MGIITFLLRTGMMAIYWFTTVATSLYYFESQIEMLMPSGLFILLMIIPSALLSSLFLKKYSKKLKTKYDAETELADKLKKVQEAQIIEAYKKL